MKKKNVLFCHANAELFGSDYVLLALLKSLNKTKTTPFVLLPYKGPLCDKLAKNNINYKILPLPVLRRSTLSLKGFVRFGWEFLYSLIAIIRIIRIEKIDLIYTNTSAVWVGGIVASIFKMPHFWQVMEIIEKPHIVSRLIRYVVWKNSTKVFCISNAVKEYFIFGKKKDIEKYSTVYHGVDLDEYNVKAITGDHIRKQLNINNDKVVVTFAGRFSVWKGQEVVAKAISKVVEKVPQDSVHFLLIGSTFPGQEYYETDLRKMIADIPNSKNFVDIVGFQNNLPEWLAASDIFLLPSTRPEPNATVTLAAMAMSLPVIGTNWGGTVESVIHEETGLLIPPSEPKKLADAIITLILKKKKRVSMGHEGLLRVRKKFSLSNYCEIVRNQVEQ